MTRRTFVTRAQITRHTPPAQVNYWEFSADHPAGRWWYAITKTWHESAYDIPGLLARGDVIEVEMAWQVAPQLKMSEGL